MQRTLGLVAALSLAAVVATPAQAQSVADTRPVTFGLQGGLSAPTGDLGEYSSMGFLVGGTLDFKPATLPVGFRFDLGYQRWGGDEDEVGELDVSTSALSLTGNAVYEFASESSLRPYVLGGLGIYRSSVEVEDEDESETDLGLQFGGGFRFPLGTLDSYVEARYHSIFSDGDASFLPIVFGVRF